MPNRRSLVAVTLAVGLITAACGGADEFDPTASPVAGSPTATPTLTPTATATAPSTPSLSPTRTPDPEELRRLDQEQSAQRTRDFIERNYPNNNYEVRAVELHEIYPVLPRDGIRAILQPTFESSEDAAAWLDDEEPVIAVELEGEARAYPLQILTWHEIVNDELAGHPLLVTYCPLCNTAIAFKRTVDGEVRVFGVSGALRRNDLIMYDRETETLWQQITGNAIVGDAAGTQLEFISSQIVSWRDFRETFPDALVLSRDTGYFAPYGENPYPFYDRPGSSTYFEIDDYDNETLDGKERVLTVDLGDDPIAFPFSALSEHVVLEAESAGQRVVAFWQPGTVSALDEVFIIGGRNVGSAGAFIPVANGQHLTFEAREGSIVDVQTGSTWNVLGKAIEGPLTGAALEAVISANHFWFAWAVFEPETRVITG